MSVTDATRRSSAQAAEAREGRAVAIVFANLKGNLGDFAILHAMTRGLLAEDPDRAVHVYSHPMRADDPARLAAYRRLAPPAVYRGPSPGQPVKGAVMTLLKLRLLPGGLGAAIDRLTRRLLPAFAPFARYDAVYFAGGEQWSGRALGSIMFATLAAVRAHGVPAYTFPFSMKPNVEKLHGRAGLKARYGMLGAPLILRDSASAEILKRAGLTPVVGVDSVFALGAEARAVPPASGRDPNRVLLVATGAEDDLAAAVSALKAADLPVELVTTCEIEDGAVMQRLAARFGIAWHAPLTWQDLVAELKASRLVVTNRLHGVILGTLADTPLLPVMDRNKVRSFVTDSGIRHAAPALGALTRPLVDAALAGRDETLSKMADYRRRSLLLPSSPLPKPAATDASDGAPAEASKAAES